MAFKRQSLKTIILDVETDNPSNSMTQQEVLTVLTEQVNLSERALDLYKKFLLDDGIHRRYFAWDDPQVLLSESPDEKMQRFEQSAVDLSVNAVQKIFNKKDRQVQDIDAVLYALVRGIFVQV